jgi:hypothetical protein
LHVFPTRDASPPLEVALGAFGRTRLNPKLE